MIDTRRRFLSAIPLGLLLTLGSAGSEPAVAQEAPRIVAEELKRLVGKGEAVIVDVRSQSAWDVSHIDGALHIPLAELSSRLKELPKRREVIAYCRGPYCLMSYDAVALLRRKGLKARRLEAGLPEWRQAGLPTESQ